MEKNIHDKLIDDLFAKRAFGLPIDFAACNEIESLRKRVKELEAQLKAKQDRIKKPKE